MNLNISETFRKCKKVFRCKRKLKAHKQNDFFHVQDYKVISSLRKKVW